MSSLAVARAIAGRVEAKVASHWGPAQCLAELMISGLSPVFHDSVAALPGRDRGFGMRMLLDRSVVHDMHFVGR